MDHSAIRCRGLIKEYGRFRALDDVDVDVREGTIHALVGQNGAGKSTCLGLMAGRQQPTGGTIEIFGEPVAFHTPRDAIDLGIRSIYQELTIVPTLVDTGQPLARVGDHPVRAAVGTDDAGDARGAQRASRGVDPA